MSRSLNQSCCVWSLLSVFCGLLILPVSAEWRDAEDTAIFPNPERGFYSYQDLANPTDEWKYLIEKQGVTLVAGKIKLEEYRETPILPEEYIAGLDRGFAAARENGLKVVVRASYGDKGAAGDYESFLDPELAIINGHIEQLAPVFERNADLIALFEAGFVGPWGEWHTTEISKTPRLQREVFFQILDHTPKSRMVLLRYPELKRSIFQRLKALDPKEAYTGSRIARTGHHNDCFLSSENDVGTYGRGESTREEETTYLSQETLFTVFGGETCAPHGSSDAVRTILELQLLHGSYLNSGYHPEVLAKWKEQDCYEEISRRLGARLVLRKGALNQGGEVALEIENIGFAPLYNERPLVFVAQMTDGSRKDIPLAVDIRTWKPGETAMIKCAVPEGEILRLGLWLPDLSERLRGDSRFAFRMANEEAWDEESGVNWLYSVK